MLFIQSKKRHCVELKITCHRYEFRTPPAWRQKSISLSLGTEMAAVYKDLQKYVKAFGLSHKKENKQKKITWSCYAT